MVARFQPNDYAGDDVDTRVFFEPEPIAPPPIPRPLRAKATTPSVIVDEERFTIPSIARPHMQARVSGPMPTPVHLQVPMPLSPPPPRPAPMYQIVAPTEPAPYHAVTEQRPRVTNRAVRLGLAGVSMLVGITIGSVIAFSGGSNVKASAAPIAAALPKLAPPAPRVVTLQVVPAPAPVAPAPAPVAPAPAIVAPPPAPVVVDRTLHVESTPAGATVTLVLAGKPSLIGPTPIDAPIDPTLEYDVIVTHEHYAPHVEHIGPTSSHHLAIALAAPAPAIVAHHHVAAPTVKGNLRVASKPPCSITVDGKATGLVTPQRSLLLPVGRHEVTLVNAEQGIHLTSVVTIEADHAATLSQDFTN